MFWKSRQCKVIMCYVCEVFADSMCTGLFLNLASRFRLEVQQPSPQKKRSKVASLTEFMFGVLQFRVLFSALDKNQDGEHSPLNSTKHQCSCDSPNTG
jgi:hypothetical protein